MDAPAPSELDLRMSAVCAEYELTISAQARRAVTLRAELEAVTAERDQLKGEIGATKAALDATTDTLEKTKALLATATAINPPMQTA